MNQQLRHFAFTWNNYEEHDKKYCATLKNSLEDLGANYYIWAYEVGEKGTPHIQGYAQLAKRKYFLAVKKALPPSVHITIVKGSSQDNINYCKKDNNYKEVGLLRDIGRARAKQSRDWALLLDQAKTGKLEQIALDNPKDYIVYYKTLRQIAIDNIDLEAIERKCLWIYGKPGVGKSRVAHTLFPSAYWKNGNKWWDGYQGEQTVVLDDLDSVKLFSYIKRWADRYKVIGEIKGGSINLTYSYFVVTSNFSPFRLGNQADEVDEVTRLAIARRFLIVEAQSWEDQAGDILVKVVDPGTGLIKAGQQPALLVSILEEEGWDFCFP